jgi:hypothetical protein
MTGIFCSEKKLMLGRHLFLHGNSSLDIEISLENLTSTQSLMKMLDFDPKTG